MKGAQTVEVIGIEKLIPYVKNSRTHSDEQVAQIAVQLKSCNSLLLAGTLIGLHTKLTGVSIT